MSFNIFGIRTTEIWSHTDTHLCINLYVYIQILLLTKISCWEHLLFISFRIILVSFKNGSIFDHLSTFGELRVFDLWSNLLSRSRYCKGCPFNDVSLWWKGFYFQRTGKEGVMKLQASSLASNLDFNRYQRRWRVKVIDIYTCGAGRRDDREVMKNCKTCKGLIRFFLLFFSYAGWINEIHFWGLPWGPVSQSVKHSYHQ